MLTTKFLIAVLAMAIPLRATTSFYLGSGAEANFNSATSALTQINGTTNFATYNGFVGPTLSDANGTGINFLGLDGITPIDLSVSGGKLQQTTADKQIEATFPGAGNILAFGIHFNYTGSASFANWFFGSTNGASDYGSVVTVGTGDLQFFGIVSTAPLTSPVYISRNPGGGTANVVIDDFKAFNSGAAPAETPEAGTIGLIGTGLVMLSAVRRRFRKGQRPLPDAERCG